MLRWYVGLVSWIHFLISRRVSRSILGFGREIVLSALPCLDSGLGRQPDIRLFSETACLIREFTAMYHDHLTGEMIVGASEGQCT